MAGNEFDPFDLDSFDFGDFDSLTPGTYTIVINCMNEDTVGDTELMVIVE